MNISEQTRISSPLPDVWPLLSDPTLVAGCIPGAQLAPDQGDGVWRGSIRVRFGPTVATFRGEATLDYDHAAHRCSIEGRGIDQRGASRALSSGTILAASEGGETLLTVDGSFTMTGPLETFANAGGIHVARAMLAEFSANMAKLIAERHSAAPEHVAAPAPSEAAASRPAETAAPTPAAPASKAAPVTPSPPPPPAPAPEISAISLLWRIFTSWLHRLFEKRTR